MTSSEELNKEELLNRVKNLQQKRKTRNYEQKSDIKQYLHKLNVNCSNHDEEEM